MILLKEKNTQILSIFIAFAFYAFFCILSFSISAAKITTPTSSFIIAIDAGHGGIDKGAYGRTTNCPESDINLSISKKLESKLNDLGFSTVMTRTEDKGLYKDTSYGFKKRDMQARKEIIESSDASLALSIHCNISSIGERKGAVIYYDEKDQTSISLANNIMSELNKIPRLKGKVRIDKEIMFMTDKIDLPSVIVECGFLSNAEEERELLKDSYQNELAKRIADGVFKTLFSSV